MKAVETCILCDQTIRGSGHNARPLADGRCCDDCNFAFVLPHRIVLAYRRIQEESE